MRVFHFYNDSDPIVGKYVETLLAAVGTRVEMKATADYGEFRRMCHDANPDIIHVHGCWRSEMRHLVALANKTGARIVVSPHGQLQPWIVNQHWKSEKMPKTLLFQRKLIARAYAVVAMGRMEEEGLRQKKWNRRIETVKNALITESITLEEMARQMVHIYNKVYDTATRHYMKPQTIDALRALVKVGIAGDARFVDNDHRQACLKLSDDEWRKILIYAHQEAILGVVALGIKTLSLSFPDIDPTAVDFYKPDNAKKTEAFNIEKITDPTERLASMLTTARLLAARHRLTMSHLVRIADALIHSAADEDRVREMAFRLKGEDFTRRLMSLVAQETLLEEGFLIAEPKEGKRTRNILKNILKQNEL